MSLIRLRGVSRHYGQGEALVKALDRIDVDINAGDFVSLMGPSGSGKSTALNVMGCLDVPTGGKYWFKGIETTTLNRKQRARLRREWIGFVFQGYNLLKRSSALENVELPLVYRGIGRAARYKRAMAALELVGLSHRATHPPSKLSGGQQQRVAIARALVTNPEVLLADEPTGNLDTARSLAIMELLTKLNAEGQTILMVTHEEDMAAYTRRILHFRDGKVENDERRAGA